jgi:hypothetical protein
LSLHCSLTPINLLAFPALLCFPFGAFFFLNGRGARWREMHNGDGFIRHPPGQRTVYQSFSHCRHHLCSLFSPPLGPPSCNVCFFLRTPDDIATMFFLLYPPITTRPLFLLLLLFAGYLFCCLFLRAALATPRRSLPLTTRP